MNSRCIKLLMVLLVGLWSPLCCCQAAALAAAVTGVPMSCGSAATPAATGGRTAESGGCCGCSRTCGEAAQSYGHDDDEPEPDDGDPTAPASPEPANAPCDDCPACQGTLGLNPAVTGSMTMARSLASIAVLFCTATPWRAPPTADVYRPPRDPPDHLSRAGGGRSLLCLHGILTI